MICDMIVHGCLKDTVINCYHCSFYYSASAYLAMQTTVLAMIDSVWPSVWPSVTVRYHAKTAPATIMRSSLEDSPNDSSFLTVNFT